MFGQRDLNQRRSREKELPSLPVTSDVERGHGAIALSACGEERSDGRVRTMLQLVLGFRVGSSLSLALIETHKANFDAQSCLCGLIIARRQGLAYCCVPSANFGGLVHIELVLELKRALSCAETAQRSSICR